MPTNPHTVRICVRHEHVMGSHEAYLEHAWDEHNGNFPCVFAMPAQEVLKRGTVKDFEGAVTMRDRIVKAYDQLCRGIRTEDEFEHEVMMAAYTAIDSLAES